MCKHFYLLIVEHRLEMEALVPIRGLKCRGGMLVWPGVSAVLTSCLPSRLPSFLSAPRNLFSFALTFNNLLQAGPRRRAPAVTAAGSGMAQGSSVRRSFVLPDRGPTEPISQYMWLSSQTPCPWRASGVFHPGMVGTMLEGILYIEGDPIGCSKF